MSDMKKNNEDGLILVASRSWLSYEESEPSYYLNLKTGGRFNCSAMDNGCDLFTVFDDTADFTENVNYSTVVSVSQFMAMNT